MIIRLANLLSTGFIVMLLSGCATLNESECRNADWHIIGLEDGSKGKLEAYIGSHRSACAEYDVIPDLTAYQEGRNEGLLHYCTERNGFALGRSGSKYNEVCPQHLEEGFSIAYSLGLEINKATRRIGSLENTISSKKNKIKKIETTIADQEQLLVHGDLTPAERQKILNEIKKLGSSVIPLEDDIYDLFDKLEQEESFLEELNMYNTYQ